MNSENWERRLTAILIADATDYSRLMGTDETETHRVMKIHREEVIDTEITAHQGHIVHTAGDGLLVEFPSVVGAVQCAVNIQRELAKRNAHIPEDRRLCWRIGINFGDVIDEPDDIYGDSVNVAARLEALAEPGGICITGRVFSEVRSKVDVGFESLGEQWLKNIVEPIHVYRSSIELVSSQSSTGVMGSQLPEVILDRPSIAVLLFANLTPNRDNQYLVNGLTEDLITDLSMSPEFFVIARNSSFAFKDAEQDLNAVASQLGVRYVVVGSLQQDDRGFRVSAQLIEAKTGIQLWAGRYNREHAELIEVRDEITHSIAATLMTTSGEIAKAELRRQARKPPESFSVYDHYLKARDYFHRSILPPWKEGKEWSALAMTEFRKAIEMSDPPYWPLYAGLAWQHAIDFDWSYSDDPEKSAELSFENAAIAVKHAPENHLAHWIMGWSYLFAERDYDRAMYHYEKARELNVGDSRMLAELAQPLIYTGQPEQAIIHLKQAIRLNPLHEQWYDEFLAWAYEESGQPEKSIEVLTKFSELEGIWSHAVLARAYAQTGQIGQFKVQIAIIDKMTQEQMGEKFSLEFWRKRIRQKDPYKDNARSDRIITIMEEALNQIKMQC